MFNIYNHIIQKNLPQIYQSHLLPHLHQHTYPNQFSPNRQKKKYINYISLTYMIVKIPHTTYYAILTLFFSKALSFNNLGQNFSSSSSPSFSSTFFITCICTDRGNTLYVDPSASTGLKKTISSSYSLLSDLPLKLSVSSFRLIFASLTSVFVFHVILTCIKIYIWLECKNMERRKYKLHMPMIN